MTRHTPEDAGGAPGSARNRLEAGVEPRPSRATPTRCPEGRDNCLNDFTVVVSTKFGSLVPQTVHASNLRETFEKVMALPLTAWFPPEGIEQRAVVRRKRSLSWTFR